MVKSKRIDYFFKRKACDENEKRHLRFQQWNLNKNFYSYNRKIFSTMKIIKNKLRNKMKVEFLANIMIIYIERHITRNSSLNSIIEDFKSLKNNTITKGNFCFFFIQYC